jgi:hypothetical protein
MLANIRRLRARGALLAALVAASLCGLGGCAFFGGAAVGAGATGTAYEVQNKQALDELDEDYRKERISKDEYLRRRKEIEDRSAIY